jgi:hypothetical protein
MTNTELISTAAVAISLLGVIWQYFGGILAIRKDMALAATTNLEAHAKMEREMRDMITAHGLQLAKAETKMELFWNAVGASVKSLIKQPIHFEKDELMDKLMDRPDLISKPELNRLKVILNDELVELQHAKNNSSLAYSLAIAYIDQILFDMNCPTIPHSTTPNSSSVPSGG